MLTLTLPHATVNALPARGLVAQHAPRDTLHARVIALWLAWPRLWRSVKRHMRARDEQHVTYHRSFEWTPASDGFGHPHFHVYLWCPFIDARIVRAWWGEALAAVGWPIERDAEDNYDVRVDLRMLRGFDVGAVRELLKGGRRQALTLSRVEIKKGRGRASGPGLDAFDYAEGWTLSDVAELVSVETQARLYMALEARRLTQASSGFFEADESPRCAVCCASGGAFMVRFESVSPSERKPAVASGCPP